MRPPYKVISGGLAALLMILAAAFDRFSNGSFGWSDVLFDGAVAFAVWTGGWAVGLLAMSIGPIALSFWSKVDLDEWVACILVVVIVAIARHTIQRLHKSEKKLRALLASMSDVILVLDKEGTYVEVVPTNPMLLYRKAEELLGRRIKDIFPPEDTQLFVGTIETALSARTTIDVDYALTIDGVRRWFSASVSPMNATLVLWVARDITARKLAEEALQYAKSELEQRVEERTRDLQATEARYRSIFEQANDIIFTLSLDRKLTSLNPAFARVTGHRVGDWLGRDAVDLVDVEHRPQAAEEFTRALVTGSIELTTGTIIGAGGRKVIIETSLVPQRIGGMNVGFLGLARDITKRERLEADRRRNEEQLAESQRIAKLGSWEIDLETARLWWSDQNYVLHGVQRTDRALTTADLMSLVPADELPRLAESHAILLANGSHEWELRIRTPAGEEKTFSCHGRLIEDSFGNRRVFGTSQDITEKKGAEELLRQSEERFRLLARATSDAIWDLDYATGHVWRGDGYEKLFGYVPGTLAPTLDCFRERVHPEDRERLSESFREAIDSGQLSFTHEFRFRRADGTYADILDRGYIVRDRDLKPTRVVGAMIDLTERQQLSEQLAQAQRLSSLGRLAGSIAHEFNNVLMGVQANAEIINRRAPDDLRPVVANVTGAVRRGRRITEEILRYMRPADPAPQPLQVRRFLRQWADEIAPSLGSRVTLEIDVAADDLWIRADPQQIAQVFTNMAFNARDAIGDGGGKLSIRADASTSYSTFSFGVVRTPDRFIHFRISDTGSGIPRDQLPHVFEPLFTTKRDGTGLGLAVSYQILMRHGGHVFVESEIGAGTTFHLFIPMCSEAVETAARAPRARATPLGRVLLVEDEPEVASGVSILLEVEGAEVQVVNSGAETVPGIERFDPDVVILDIGLPDKSGVEVYAEIAQRWPSLPVLFSSGHAQTRTLEPWLARPNVSLLVKPYEMADLCEALRRLLDDVAA